MGNCLVTKLKGVVDNSNLPKLGEITIHRNKYTGNYQSHSRLQIEQLRGSSISVTIGGTDSVWSDADASYVNAVRSLDHAKHGFILSPTKEANIDISILGKYNLTLFTLGSDMYTDLNTLAYSPLVILNLASGDYSNPYRGSANGLNTGDLKEIVKSSKATLQVIALPGVTALTGDLMDLVDCDSLRLINFVGCQQLTGDFLQFVNAKVAKGITTGQIKTTNAFAPFTLNGHSISSWSENPDQQSINWDNSKIYAITNNTTSTSKSVFCYGYSDSEIESLMASGGAWEGYKVTKCN